MTGKADKRRHSAQKNKTMDQICEIKVAYMRAGAYEIRAPAGSTAGSKSTTSLALHLEIAHMDVGHQLRVLAWDSCWTKKNEGGMPRLWKFTMARES